MDQETNAIEEYFSKLPPVVQDCITSAEWMKRVNEMIGKYSLNETQSASLQYEILFATVGIEPEEDLSQNIEKEVGVSHLLAEQLVKDINDRLFSWIDKTYESKAQKPNKEPAPKPEVKPEPSVPKPTLTETKVVAPENPKVTRVETKPLNPFPKMPDFKSRPEAPVNLPTNQTAETIRTTKSEFSVPKYTPAPSYKPTSSIPQEVKPAQTPEKSQEKPLEKSEVPQGSRISYVSKTTNEPVQQPISVPRFTAVKEETIAPTAPVSTTPPPNKTAAIQNVIDNKLSNITSSVKEAPKTETAPKAYSVDPYREPIN